MPNKGVEIGLNVREKSIVHSRKITTADLLKHFIDSEQKYKTRWNVYHAILCIGVWGILACTVWGVFVGWK
jgi:hypothetical protein